MQIIIIQKILNSLRKTTLKNHFLEQIRYFGLQDPVLQGGAYDLQDHPDQIIAVSLPDSSGGQMCSQGRVIHSVQLKLAFFSDN